MLTRFRQRKRISPAEGKTSEGADAGDGTSGATRRRTRSRARREDAQAEGVKRELEVSPAGPRDGVAEEKGAALQGQQGSKVETGVVRGSSAGPRQPVCVESLEFYETLASGSQAFCPLVQQFGPPRFEGRDVFTALVRAVVWQQLSSKAATSIWLRFLAAIECPLDTPPEPSPSPSKAPVPVLQPHMFDNVECDLLRKAGLSQRKADYILNIAGMFRSGSLAQESLAELCDEDVKSALIELKGVGAWTVDMVLMFSLQRPDVLPVGDLAVRKGAMKFFKLKSMPSEEQMRILFEPFRPYRSYASWYMWHVVDPTFQLPD